MEKKVGFAQRRKMEETGEVEMKDVDAVEKKGAKENPKSVGALEGKMELDGIE